MKEFLEGVGPFLLEIARSGGPGVAVLLMLMTCAASTYSYFITRFFWKARWRLIVVHKENDRLEKQLVAQEKLHAMDLAHLRDQHGQELARLQERRIVESQEQTKVVERLLAAIDKFMSFLEFFKNWIITRNGRSA